jgi:ribonucleotide monophosphatase NagD (HAD superfamily)
MVTSDDFALAFDIDGVLIKGGEPIPKAVDAMKYINGDNPYRVKVYVISMPCLPTMSGKKKKD